MTGNGVARFALSGFLFVSLAQLGRVTPAAAGTVSWNVDTSGFWDAAANWSTGMVPQAGDDVVIDRPAAAVTVTFRSGTVLVNTITCREHFAMTGATLSIAAASELSDTFTMSGGTLTGAGVVVVGGLFTWSGGTIRGSGSFTANGGVQITNSGAVSLSDTRTFNNAALATWTGAGGFSNGAGIAFNNLAGATFSIETTGDFLGGTFHNAGVVQKLAGGGDRITRFTATLDNSATVNVLAGTLELNGGGTQTGVFTVEPLAVLQLGGVQTFNPGSSMSGGGTVRFAAGATAMNAGAYAITGSTELVGGTHTINPAVTLTALGGLTLSNGVLILNSGELVTPTQYTQTGGTLSGTDTVNVATPLTLSGGTLAGTGRLRALAGGQIATSPVVLSDTRAIDNGGDLIWSGSGSITAAAGVTFNNLSGASFHIDTSADFLGGTLNNSGSVQKTAGGGDQITRLTAALNNSGAVDVLGGTLQLNGGGTHSGSFSAAAQAVLQFGGGTHTFTAGSVNAAGTIRFSAGSATFQTGTYEVSGATEVLGGTHTFNAGIALHALGALSISGGTLDLSSGEPVTPTAYSQTGGTLTGSDAVTLATPFNWSGGIVRGTGVFTANSGVQLTNTAAVTLDDTRMFNNAGLMTWTGTGGFSNGAGGTFNNLTGAMVSIETPADFLGGTFNNAGVVRKLAGGGDGMTRFTGAFLNTGTVSVASGLLRFDGTYNQTAGTARLEGGSLQTTALFHINGGTLTGSGSITGPLINGGDLSPGSSAGRIDISGSYLQTPSGVLTVEIGGAQPSEFDTVAVAGAATLDGSLRVLLIGGFVPAVGAMFPVLSYGSHTGDFATGSGLVIGNGLGFSRVPGPTSLTLTVVQENCSDELDHDGDGLAGCLDPKCADAPPCLGTRTVTATTTITPTPTRRASATPTPTANASSTFTATATQTLSASATAAATVTGTVGSGCVGDCNQDGDVTVTVDELVIMVNIALGARDVSACIAGDGNHDGEITVDEIVTAVNNALNGCGVRPTPTARVGEPARAIAGAVAVAGKAMSTIPSIIAAVVNGIQLGGGSAAALQPRASNCPLGGTASRTGNIPSLSVTLTECKVATADGTETFNGSAAVQLTSFMANLEVRFADTAGDVTQTVTADVAGSVAPRLGPPCFLTAVTLQLSTGTLQTTTPAGSRVGLTFTGTSLSLENITFNPACVPVVYDADFDGRAGLLAGDATPVTVTFMDLSAHVDDQARPTTLVFSGGMSAPCFGGAVTLATAPPVAVANGAICPSAGTITATLPQESARVSYRSDGSVDIDRDGDGVTDETAPNCLDPRLLMCAA